MKSASITLLFAGCLLVGCSSNSSEPTPTASSTTRLKIVYIPKNTGNPYFSEVQKGFEDAAKEINADFVTTAPAIADATSQIPTIKEQIQRGVDVIAITPNSPDALNTVLDQARAKGITVVTVDADLVGNETHRDACVLPADFDEIGPSQLDLLAKQIGSEGNFAILSATTDAPNQNAWIAKLKTALADPKYSRMKLIDTVYGDDDPQKSTTECEALLAKYPDLRGIISPTSVGLAASAQVVERMGVYPGGPKATGKGLVLTGLSTPNQLRKAVDKGVVTSFQLWSPRDEGYVAAILAKGIHDKTITPTAGGTFKAGSKDGLKFSDKLEVIAGPLVTFDKANISKYDF